MRAPRLSIIPARAATDRELKPRDLQVLCVLGRHTDELGWCRRSQVKMAREMDCARSTVQAAIGRLTRQGYLEQFQQETESGRDSSHLYRVILDPIHEDISTVQLEETDRDESSSVCETSSKLACRSVGTPADIPAPPAGPEPAPPAGPESAPMLTTPLNDPLLKEKEGACERDKVNSDTSSVKHLSPAKTNRVFNSLMSDWPGDRGSSPRNAMREFEKLTPAEQLTAFELRDDWIALLRSQGRTLFPAPSKYLADKLWLAVPKGFRNPEQTAKNEKAPPFGKMWGAIRFADLMREPYGHFPAVPDALQTVFKKGGELAEREKRGRLARYGWPKVKTMHERAISGRKGVVSVSTLETLTDLFVEVHRNSSDWIAWRDLHEKKGWPWFGPDRDCPEWVWMPAPPDDPGTYRTPFEAVRAALARFEVEHAKLTKRQAAE